MAVVNRKGGSGKSTLATHLATWLSLRGDKVMLGDVDRQRSTVPWLRRRAEQSVSGEPIQGWVTDARNVLRPPPGVRHVVLDTPGGLQGLELGRIVMYADILLLPLGDSLFDRESAAACLEELRAHPRVAGGRVQLGVVGMRLEWTRFAEGRLQKWSGEQSVPMVAAIRDSRAFVSAAERGLTILDLPEEQVPSERIDLQVLFDWVDKAIAAIPAPALSRPVVPSRAAAESVAGEGAVAGGALAAPAAVSPGQGAVPASPGMADAAGAASSVSEAAKAPGPSRTVPAGAGAGASPASTASRASTASGGSGSGTGVPEANIPISLIQLRSRPAGALTQLRRWFGRVLPGTDDN